MHNTKIIHNFAKNMITREEFIKKMTDACNEIERIRSKGEKFVYDALGRIYIYKDKDELNNIRLDSKALTVAKILAEQLI